MRGLVFAVCAALLVGSLAPTARADGTIASYVPGAHTLSGELGDGERHFVPLQLPAGTMLSITFRADLRRNRGNELVPIAELFGPDGDAVEIPSPNTRRGFVARNIPLPDTGRYTIVLSGDNGTGGKYTLRTRARLPRPIREERDFGDGPFEVDFPADTGAKVTFLVLARRGNAVPDAPLIRRPDGGEFGPPNTRTTRAGVVVRNYEQTGGGFGAYTLVFGLRPGTEDGARVFRYVLSVRYPRTRRARIEYDDLIVTPTLFDITPNQVSSTNQIVSFTIGGRFFQEGSQVEIRLGNSSVQLDTPILVEGGLRAATNTFGLPPGRWTVIVTSPSGGTQVLASALTVLPEPPTITSVSPTEGGDDLFDQRVTLTGSRLSEATELTFRMDLPGGGEEVFVPNSVSQSSATSIDVTVNIARRPLGAYDVEARNRGPTSEFDSTTVVVPNAFSIVNAPPRIDSASPGCITAGDPLTLALRGREIEAGVRAFMRLGEIEIEGTSLDFNIVTQTVTADFDLSGQPGGSWDAALLNTDGREGELADAVQVVSGPITSLTNEAIGQPDLAIATVDERLLAVWVESDEDGELSGNSWHVRGQLFDTSDDTPVGNVITISDPTKSDMPKRFVSAVYNPSVEEWLVVWTEHTSVPFVLELANAQGIGFSQDPRPSVPGTVFQTYARRVALSGQPAGGIIDLIKHEETPVSSPPNSSQYYDEFPYENPQVVYAPWNENYYLCMTQRWDHTSGSEDYDIYVWELDRDDPDFDEMAHAALHTTQNHEGDVLLAVDFERQQFLAVGACDSRQLSSPSAREIEAKVVLSNLTVQPGSGGSNVGEVYPITTRGGDSRDFLNPRTDYDPNNDQYLIVYERTNESGSGKVEVRGQLFDAVQRVVVGSELTIGADPDLDLRRPRVIYNAEQREYLVTWTLDDTDGDSFARGRRLNPSDGSPKGSSFDLACDGTGYPVVQVDSDGSYLVLVYLEYGALDTIRSGERLLLRRIE